MKSVWTPYNAERIRRERWEAFFGWLRLWCVPLAIGFLFAAVATYALPKAATEANAIRVEVSE
ncbi:hypothetical protein [Dinoroseobacter sp. S124A]|uniref:hypothetical protein n=1 Tax=Dinoroseobacter sp. S124A TaxID=3415128 RepID=UPI003C7A45BC